MPDGTRREVVHEGCRISYQRTGTKGTTPLLLVHGGGAHAGWWSEIVPRLAGSFDMIVPDLCGHGDSGHREAYSPQSWVDDLAAILQREGIEAVRLVGHSMGGQIGMFMAADLPASVESLVLMDPILRRPDPETGSVPRGRGWHPTSVHATVEEALDRFRLGRTSAAPGVVRRVAEEAVRQVADGWTWKFDPRVSRRFTDDMLHQALARVTCPVHMIYGQQSPVASADTVAYIESRIGREVSAIVIEDAHHHVPLDRPAACTAAIRQTFEATPPLHGSA